MRFRTNTIARRRCAVLVAPYAPGQATTKLGANRKIELVTGLLRRLGFAVHLVDSSHPEVQLSAPVLGERREVEGQEVVYWRPFCLPSRKVGKLLNAYFSASLFARIAALRPDLVWIYNSYAFEGRLGLFLRRRTNCRLVFELEDLPRARGRGWNPKPILDQIYFGPLLRQADLVTVVNSVLLERFASRASARAVVLLPSILGRELAEGASRLRFGGPVHRLGYFGALEPEKGVAVLLNLLPSLPSPWRLTVTGAGTLEEALRTSATEFPDRIEFHGRVSHRRVTELMHDCDAIVNPHASIADMRDGVFPFKVCEAIGSGGLVISTPLPAIDIDLSRAVLFYDGSVRALATALGEAKHRYDVLGAEIVAAREAVWERYGEEAVLRSLGAAIEPLLRARDPGQMKHTPELNDVR